MIVANGSVPVEEKSVTLFAFDDQSLPNIDALKLTLQSGKPGGDGFVNPGFSPPNNRVLVPGPKGAPDDMLVIYYGNVFVGPDGLLWMYYLAAGSTDPVWKGKAPTARLERLCLAKSKDGQHWTKPKLGLVDYNGSKDNNLLKFTGNPGGDTFLAAGIIFYDPDEKVAAKKFKMIWENQGMNRQLHASCLVSFSADGLTWDITPKPSVSMEMSGGVILPAGTDGTPKRYVVAGHGGAHFPPGRRMVLFQSYDFDAWDSSTVSGFNRVPQAPKVPVGNPDYLYGNAGEQCHLGAGLKARPGIVLGMYGQWHGHPSNDRRLLTMDLGFVISNCGLHFREPIPDFRMIPCAEDESTLAEAPWAAQKELIPNVVDFPANVQGNGMENVGDKTLFWYGTWPEVDADGVRCAVWGRDRLGCLATDDKLKAPASGATVTSCPIKCNASGTVKVSLNVEGTGSGATAKVDILTEQFAPLPGYTADDCIVTDGLRSPVLWKTASDAPGAICVSEGVYASHLVALPVEAAAGRIRVRVTIAGSSKQNVRFYAMYLDDPSAIQTDADIPDIYQPPANADELLAAAAAGVDPDPDLAEFQEVTVEDGHVVPQLPDEGGEVLPETPAEEGPDSSNKKGNSSGGGGGLVDKLRELKELFEAEFLTAEEFAQAKAAILARASAGPKQAK